MRHAVPLEPAVPAPSRRATCAVAALTLAGLTALVPAAGAATTTRYQVDFQANNGLLYRTGPGGPANLLQGMAPGTSPATTELGGGGLQTAFQANTGELIVFGDRQTVNTRQGMLAGTSPSIASEADGSFVVAFQANNGRLYTYSSLTGPEDTGLAMAPGTSPAIATAFRSGYDIALQGANGNLVQAGTPGFSSYDTEQGMAPGTSPSVDSYTTATRFYVQWAFQANTGNLFLTAYQAAFDGEGVSYTIADTQQGMKAGTSPATAALGERGFQTAFQANTGQLVYQGVVGANTGQGMLEGTSPSIVATAGGGWLSGFQANNGYLYTYSSSTGPANTQQGMLAGTNPSIG